MIVYKFLDSPLWDTSLYKQRKFHQYHKYKTKGFIHHMSNQYGWSDGEPKGGLFYSIDAN